MFLSSSFYNEIYRLALRFDFLLNTTVWTSYTKSGGVLHNKIGD